MSKAHAEQADHVVISQVYGGGGNSGAPFNKDFVELYNPTSTNQSILLDGLFNMHQEEELVGRLLV